MLILARKKNQSIVINDNIEIYIVDISPDQVKIGIEAPKDVSIHRKEVYENIKKQMQEAASSSLNKIANLRRIKKKGSSAKNSEEESDDSSHHNAD